MNKKYISLVILLAAFAALTYVVPTITDNILCIIAGFGCIGAMYAAYRIGGLDDAEDR